MAIKCGSFMAWSSLNRTYAAYMANVTATSFRKIRHNLFICIKSNLKETKSQETKGKRLIGYNMQM